MIKPSFGELVWVVCRDVNRTFGGGIAAMELIRRTFDRRGWFDAENHALLVAVSRLTPGTNILAYCTALGWQVDRAAGAAAALLASSGPSAVLVFALAATLVRVESYRGVQALLAVALVAAGVLVFSTAWHLITPYIAGRRRMLAVAVMALTAALIAFDVSPVRILIVAAVVGGSWPVRKDRTRQAGNDGRTVEGEPRS